MIDGLAEINKKPSLDELLKWATKIGTRYLGQDKAEEAYRKESLDSCFAEFILVKIRPKKIIAQKEMLVH